jgi:hypothetical protein
MDTNVETIEDAISQESEPETQPDPTQPGEALIESQLTQEISNLWSNHVRLSTNHKTTAKELRLIRASLAERLFAMKTLLSRPGRGGQWHSWLRERGIPRSTADRLAARHAETLGTADNVPTGAIWEPAKDGPGMKLAKIVWPQILKHLTTDESVVEFISGIVTASGINHQWRTKGLLIFNPMRKAADGLPVSACATEPASQPPEEPAEETIPAPPAADQSVDAADSSHGDVACPGAEGKNNDGQKSTA